MNLVLADIELFAIIYKIIARFWLMAGFINIYILKRNQGGPKTELQSHMALLWTPNMFIVWPQKRAENGLPKIEV